MDSRYYPEVNEEEEEPEDEGKGLLRWHVSHQQGQKEQALGCSLEDNVSELLPWEINLLHPRYYHPGRISEIVLKQVTTHLC